MGNVIGILGGMSPVATGEYYQIINQLVKEKRGGHHSAELLINSVDFAVIERCVRTAHWEEAAEYLSQKARQLERGGASCLFLATNTMHKVREAIISAISIPFVDIFETVGRAILQKDLKKVGLLGTYPVMNDAFYRDVFHQQGIEIISPNDDQKTEIDRIIFDELTKFKFLPEAKSYYLNTIQELRTKGAEGIILGCTEIKLLIQENDVPSLPLFDTTQLHCAAAADICLDAKSPLEYLEALHT